MALPVKQILDLPIVGGLSQKEDSLLTVRPLAMTNCVYRKSGAVEKRYGYTGIGIYNKRSDGSTPARAEHLTTLDQELLRIGDGYLDTFSVLGTTSDWINRGKVSECHLTYERIATGEALTFDPDSASNTNYTVTVYTTFESATSGAYRVCAEVSDNATSARIQSHYVLSTTTAPTAAIRTKVLLFNNYAYAFWYEGTDIKYASLSLANLTWTSAAVLVSGVNGCFDVNQSGGTMYMAYQASSGATPVTVKRFTLSAGVATNTLTANVSADTGLTAVTVYFNGAIVILAYAKYVGGTYTVVSNVLTSSLSTVSGATSLQTAVTGDAIWNIGVSQSVSSRFMIVWSRYDGDPYTPTRAVYWQEVNTTNAAFYSAPKVTKQMFAVSKPFLRGTQVYLLAMNTHATHGTYFLVNLGAGANNTLAMKMVGTVAARQAPFIGSYYLNPGTMANVNAASASSYVIAGSTLGEASNTRDSVTLFSIIFDETKRTSVQGGNLLCVGGGLPTLYDRNTTFEAGFAYEPDIKLIPSPTIDSYGSMTLSGIYNYKFVYEHFDATGRRHQSAPSLNFTVTLGSTDHHVTMALPCLHLTNRATTATTVDKVQIGVYRTVAGGSIYYRVPVDIVLSTINGSNVTVSDTYADTTIALNEKLYTEGNVVDNVIPPSATGCHIHKKAIFLFGTDDDSIWISKEILPGEGIAFSDIITIAPFEGGRVIGLATLESLLVIFKESGIWVIQGEPPNDLGESNFTAPQRIQSDVGCTDVKSIVSGPDGVYFHAGKAGLHLFTRNQEVVPVGKNVEDLIDYSVDSDGSFAGAAVLPNQSLVRFAQYGTSSNHVLNYDYYHSRALQTPVWSNDTVTDPLTGDGYGVIYAATIWNGSYVWIGGSNGGTLYRENTSSYLDQASSSSNWVPLSFQTGFEKATGISGFHQVWRFNILGATPGFNGLSVTTKTDLGDFNRVWSYSEVAAIPEVQTRKVFQVHAKHQKISWMSISIVDADPGTLNRGTGKGFALKGITLEIGIKSGIGRVPATNKK